MRLIKKIDHHRHRNSPVVAPPLFFVLEYLPSVTRRFQCRLLWPNEDIL